MHNVRNESAAQVAKGMRQYKIAIPGISECRWAGSTRLKIGETALRTGEEDSYQRGVANVVAAITATPEATKNLMESTLVSSRIISARFCSWKVFAQEAFNYTCIAPTCDASDNDKDQFYKELQAAAEGLNRHDLVIITAI